MLDTRHGLFLADPLCEGADRRAQGEPGGELVVQARLLDLVPGRSGETYKTWLKERGEAFRAGVEVATLDPFHGYKNAIDNQLEDARSVLDAFHVVKVRHEALCVRMEVRDLHRLVVAAAGLKLRAA